MFTVLLRDVPVAIVRVRKPEKAIAMTRWLLKETPILEVEAELSADTNRRYSARECSSAELALFQQRASVVDGEGLLGAILI